MSPSRLLIIDDEPENREVYQDLLQIHGFETRGTVAASEALALLADRDFDGIIIHLRKSAQAIDLVSRIKTYNPFSCIFIITGDPDPSFIKNAMNLGVEGCIIKPFPPVILLESVKRGIERVSLTREHERLKREFTSLREHHAFLKENYGHMREQVILDPASGAFNQAYLMERLASEVKRAMRHEHWMSLMLIRAPLAEMASDHKSEKIRQLALFLLKHIRSTDVLGSYGEDFLILMPETDEKGAGALRSRIREVIAHLDSGDQNDKEHFPSLSETRLHMATSTFPVDSCLPKKLIHAAEARLEPVYASP